MRTNGKTPVVIFSLNDPLKALDAINAFVPDNKIERGTGCFEGKREQAYSMELSLFSDDVKAIIAADGQAAVLYLDNQYNAWLSPADKGYPTWLDKTMPKYIGEFRETTETQAFKRPGWSRFGGRYFVAG